MKIVAVMACPFGLALTYLAAEALESAAMSKGIEIKVETQGSMGVNNYISIYEAKAADIVILAKDNEIEGIERFEGKFIIKIDISDVIETRGRFLCP